MEIKRSVIIEWGERALKKYLMTAFHHSKIFNFVRTECCNATHKKKKKKWGDVEPLYSLIM